MLKVKKNVTFSLRYFSFKSFIQVLLFLFENASLWVYKVRIIDKKNIYYCTFVVFSTFHTFVDFLPDIFLVFPFLDSIFPGVSWFWNKMFSLPKSLYVVWRRRGWYLWRLLRLYILGIAFGGLWITEEKRMVLVLKITIQRRTKAAEYFQMSDWILMHLCPPPQISAPL